MEEESVDEWTLDGVLDELADISRSMQDRQFAFILGAGASASSGIPTGKSLAEKWLQELHRRECRDDCNLEEWIDGGGLGVENVTFDSAAEHYPKIFDRRFKHDREAGYAALERAMDGKSPSLGYSLLAEIIQRSRHKVVVTTNFDNLVADALAMHAHQSPLVVAHESLAGFVRPQLRRPLVAKIHRDLFFEPQNDEKGVGTLDKAWISALRKLFQYFTPVVVGYGGNDGSLMGLLESLELGEISGRMVWCYRDQPPSGIAMRVLKKHNGIQVKIPGFDDFMLRLAERLVDKFDVVEIASRTEKLGVDRSKRYREQSEQLQRISAVGTYEQQKTGRVLARSADSGKSWWAWELKARDEPDVNVRKEIFLQGLENFPSSADLVGSYANFLIDVMKDDVAAESMYERALVIDPENSTVLGNYAMFLGENRDDHERTEAMFRKSLYISDDSASVSSGYASFLMDKVKRFADAEVMFQRALEVDAKSLSSLANYAFLLTAHIVDFERAQKLYERAMAVDDDDPDNYVNYAAFLICKGDEESLRKARSLISRALEICNGESSQAHAEALFYNSICAEFDMSGADEWLGRLKSLLGRGFAREPWDFTHVLNCVLPRLEESKQTLFILLSTAVLNQMALPALEENEVWRSIPCIEGE